VVSSSVVLRDFAPGWNMKPFKANMTKIFWIRIVFRIQHRAVRGRKRGKSEQKGGHEEKGSGATRSRSPDAEEKSFHVRLSIRPITFAFRTDLRTAVSSHPYNYIAVSFCSSTFGPSGSPLSRFSLSPSPRSLSSHGYVRSLRHKIWP